ncbi:FeoA domain-containing protein [Pararhodospirillum oryzae]|uniref:Ferrous iron transporter FeoA-like domain-containing protein n=1 Tax=Pararhodospirillum oryzae TaxID=478448 RepID=A0A512H503_9PROT|nr:FeoA domain-containing protein [Pararhodospirillum oryzae]GEO80546.1 hypothetical protein ROR02_06770 [Pararhodospirillum oryzae]
MAFHGESALLAPSSATAAASPCASQGCEGAPDRPLADSGSGGPVLVTGILGGRKIARDLGDLGVRVGNTLTVVRRLTGGGVAVRRGGMTVAIGALLARQVMVRATCP